MWTAANSTVIETGSTSYANTVYMINIQKTYMYLYMVKSVSSHVHITLFFR